MNKSISSQPEASKFRSILVIIIVLICMVSFLSYTENLSQQAEEIARKRVVNDINHSLAMMLYDYTIKGKQHQLEEYDRQNPFVPLAIFRSLPTNYHGVLTTSNTKDLSSGWYFDRRSKISIFISQNGNRFEYVMRYKRYKKSSIGVLEFQQN